MTYTNTTPYAALMLRLALGTMFIAHALLKILVFTPAGTAGFFASLGVPGWLAYPVMGLELLGGLMLLAGIQVRAVAVALLPVLIGSIVLVHAGNGWLFSNEHGGWEYPLFLTVATMVQALLGGGAYSIGELVNRSKSANTGRVATV
jgi:putative oxidoreductase